MTLKWTWCKVIGSTVAAVLELAQKPRRPPRGRILHFQATLFVCAVQAIWRNTIKWMYRTQGKGSTHDALRGINYKKGSFYAVPTLHHRIQGEVKPLTSCKNQLDNFLFIRQAITPAIQPDSQCEVNKPSTHVVLSLWHLKVIPRSWLTPGPNRKRLLLASRGHRGPNLPFTSFMRKKSWHIFVNVYYIPLICHKASRRFKINQAKLEVT